MKEGWLKTTIGEICTLKSGNSLSPDLTLTSGDIPYVKVADMSYTGNEKLISTSSRFVNQHTIKKHTVIPVGATIFPKRGGAILTNKKRITSVPICADLNIMAVIPSPKIDSRLLYYYFINIDMRELGSGSSIPQINNYDIAPLPISIPKSLSEQRRIVSILDEAFEAIAIAKANTEQNLLNAREVFESQLNAVFSQRGEGWVVKRLEELAELKGRIGWRGLTAKEYTDEGPLFLSVHSLNYGDYVDYRDAFHISEERYIESPEIMLEKNDVLICKDGAGIGKLGIVGDLPSRATINSSLLLIRSGKEILPKYLYFCLSSPYFQAIVNSRLNGATTPHLYQRDIKEFPVVLPSLFEQMRITSKIDAFSSNISQLETTYQRKLAALDELKQSLLHQAFSGKL